ncbi:hypothetical protein PINS_up023756 [Pythium insidiosum]|nr:hypothetical protein PINS_up023756 [Pythium insidiosum]
MASSASFLASVRVLFWKNWRVKQRESSLNRKRATTPGTWLFPPLITDIVLPLCFILYLVQLFCGFNAELVDTSDMNLSQRQLASIRAPLVTSSSTVSMMTSLPLVLSRTKRKIVLLDRPENRAFLDYLEQTYPGDDALGFLSIKTFATIVPMNSSIATDSAQADAFLESFPKAHPDVDVYAALDIRQTIGSASKEARVFLDEDDANENPGHGTADQMNRYFKLFARDGHTDRFVRLPGILPLQAELDLFLRGKRAAAKHGVLSLSPKRACRQLSFVLDDANMRWTDLAASSPLGNGVDTCVKALKSGRAKPSTLLFLSRLVEQASSSDELKNVAAGVLPARPKKVVSGHWRATSSSIWHTSSFGRTTDCFVTSSLRRRSS